MRRQHARPHHGPPRPARTSSHHIVIASIQIGNAILAEAPELPQLGINSAAHPSWGGMLQDMRQNWLEAWWTAVIPGMAISIAVLAFNLFGDALRDILDPRLRQSS